MKTYTPVREELDAMASFEGGGKNAGTSPHQPSQEVNIFVTIETNCDVFTASFNPVAEERSIRTKALNELVRQGFRSPRSSTR